MSQGILQNDDFFVPRSALIASLILHLMIPTSWLTVKALEALGIHLFPQNHIKEVYQQYVQVDLVGLPDVAVADLENIDTTLPEVEKPAPIQKQVEAEDDSMVLEARQKAAAEKEKADRLEKAKQAAKDEEKKKALKAIEEEMKREQALKALSSNKEKGRLKLKGNIVSKGTAAVGNLGTPKDQFTGVVMSKIKEHFFIMPSQRNRGLTNTVHLELFPTGRVRSKKFVKGSSDSLFDSAVMQAIEDAQPLPIPEDLSLIQGGITVTFRAEE